MDKIYGITLKSEGKIYYFNGQDLELEKDSYAVVETEKGIQMGKIMYLAENDKVNIPVEDACYVIPQGNEYKVDITISTFENTGTSQVPVWTKRDTKTYDDVDLTLEHGEHNIWQPGFVYRYTAELNPTTHVIRFTADASKWTDDIEDDKDISE